MNPTDPLDVREAIVQRDIEQREPMPASSAELPRPVSGSAVALGDASPSTSGPHAYVNDSAAARRAAWLVIALYVVLAAPTLVLSYLPMTDYPQHVAIVSILRHFHDPAFDFARWFEIDVGRTLYLLPYAIAYAFSHVASVDTAMHLLAFLSVIAYPLGILGVLCALGRPPELALLAAPFVYNRAFYWGFINFNLSIGLALLALASFIHCHGERKRAATTAFTVAISATVVTHVYGLGLFLGVVALWAVGGGWAEVRPRARLLLVPLVGAAVWFALGRRAEGYGVPVPIGPPLSQRLLGLGNAICGGFVDGSDNALLFVGLALLLFVAIKVRGKTAPGPFEVAIACLCLGNLLLYFVLPQAAWTAKFIHFRHAFLALAFAPLLPVCAPRSIVLRAAPIVVALAVVANAWVHLVRFDREASPFDDIVASAPMRGKGIGMNLAQTSAVVKPEVYLHFIAYVQARKGGFVAMSFPQTFWNVPIKVRSDAGVPATPPDFEWLPQLWDEAAFGWFYDWALVRVVKQRLATSAAFPFERAHKRAPWQIYVRAGSP